MQWFKFAMRCWTWLDESGRPMSKVIPYRRHDSKNEAVSLYPAYQATVKRAPRLPLIVLPHTLSEVTGPVYGDSEVKETDRDLTRQHASDPQGQRIIVKGRVVDDRGRPVRHTLVEIWQANSAGRYAHNKDDHAAPLDPNFTGAGRTLTDADGSYEFVTIKPGAYPWQNHDNAWRPAHIHFSLFGNAFATRLVTQMYFPDGMHATRTQVSRTDVGSLRVAFLSESKRRTLRQRASELRFGSTGRTRT